MRHHIATITLAATFFTMAADGQSDPNDGGWSLRKWSTVHNGQALRLTSYVPTFVENFDTLDCVEGQFGRPSGLHKWYSYGKFGAAVFLPCDDHSGSPIQIRNGRLVITLSYENGRWQSGAVATMSPAGEGFKQRYGLYSARIRLPRLGGAHLKVWPAFWLLARYTKPGSSYSYSEMDVMESFGADQVRYHSTLYEWPPKPRVNGLITSKRAKRLDVTMNIYDGEWHTYSVDWSPSRWSIYLDDRLVGHIPSQPDQTLPMYPIIDLALYAEPERSLEDSRYSMEIDWVKVYAKKSNSDGSEDAK